MSPPRPNSPFAASFRTPAAAPAIVAPTCTPEAVSPLHSPAPASITDSSAAPFHRSPTAPALALGLRQGGWCVGSCWLLMIATMATVDRFALPLAGGIAVMAGVAAFIMWQKSPSASAQSIRMVGVAVVVATVVLYATGLADGGAAHNMATMSSPALA
jgi:hypothetical protein